MCRFGVSGGGGGVRVTVSGGVSVSLSVSAGVCVSLSVSGGVLASVSVAVDLCTKSSGGVVCSFESERRKVTRQGKARQDNSTPVQH